MASNMMMLPSKDEVARYRAITILLERVQSTNSVLQSNEQPSPALDSKPPREAIARTLLKHVAKVSARTGEAVAGLASERQVLLTMMPTESTCQGISLQLDLELLKCPEDVIPLQSLKLRRTWDDNCEISYSNHLQNIVALLYAANRTLLHKKPVWTKHKRSLREYIFLVSAKDLVVQIGKGKKLHQGMFKSVYEILRDPPKMEVATHLNAKADLLQAVSETIKLLQENATRPRFKDSLGYLAALGSLDSIVINPSATSLSTDSFFATIGNLLKLIEINALITSSEYDDLGSSVKEGCSTDLLDEKLESTRLTSETLGCSLHALAALICAVQNPEDIVHRLGDLQGVQVKAERRAQLVSSSGVSATQEQSQLGMEWGKAAFAYLGSLTERYQSFLELSFPAQIPPYLFATHLKDLRLYFVRCKTIQSEQADRVAPKIDIESVLSSENGPSLSMFKEYIRKLPESHRRLFDNLELSEPGPLHCEAILLGLYKIVRRIRKAYTKGQSQGTTRDLVDQYFKTEEHSIDHDFYPVLKRMLKQVILESSRPSCPSCYRLSEQNMQHWGTLWEMKNHGEWKGFDVPSFLPRKYLIRLERQAKVDLLRAIEKACWAAEEEGIKLISELKPSRRRDWDAILFDFNGL